MSEQPPADGDEHTKGAGRPDDPTVDADATETCDGDLDVHGHGGVAASPSTDDPSRPENPVHFAPRRSRQERLAQRRKRRRWRRITGLTTAAVGVLVLVFAGWVAWRAYQAYQHLQSSAALVSQIESKVEDVTAVDAASVRNLVGELQDQASAGRGAVSDPLYGLASHLPWIGPNLAAVRSMAVTVDELAQDTVPSLLDIAKIAGGSALTPQNGAIDLAPIKRVSSALQAADAAVNAGRARMAAINRGDLIDPVNQAVLDLWQKLDHASSLTATGARVGRLMPEMLGSDGARTYLVVFQNPAELRATGGIFGSYVLVRVDGGKISIVSQGASSRDIGTFDAPVVQQSPQLRDLYTDLRVTSPMDVNFTPDFPTAASTFATMYQQRTGRSVDGVVAFDPVAVSYLLAGHAPIDVGHGIHLTSDNVVRVLLSKAYAMFPEGSDASARDAFLAHATQAVFAAIMSGGSDPHAMLHGLQKAAAQRRLLIWSAHSDEEKDLSPTSLAGRIASSNDAAPRVGVFFNDGTGAKLGYYLDGKVNVAPGSCVESGSRDLTVTITMRYTAPDTGLPDYVLGLAMPGTPYVLRTNVMVLAPEGGSVSSVTEGGRPVPVRKGEDHGRPVSMMTVDLSPGQQTTVVAVVAAPRPSGVSSGETVQPVVTVTPGVSTWPVTVPPYPACRTAGDGARRAVSGR